MEQRQLVTFINSFITSTVTFLNHFVTHCETKMMKSEQRLQKISASLCILETKVLLSFFCYWGHFVTIVFLVEFRS